MVYLIAKYMVDVSCLCFSYPLNKHPTNRWFNAEADPYGDGSNLVVPRELDGYF